MKLATYSFKADKQKRFGFVHETYMIDILRASAWANKTHNNSNFLHIPSSLKLALENWEPNLSYLKDLQNLVADNIIIGEQESLQPIATNIDDIKLYPPITDPQSFRDFYAFEQHVKSARRLRGLDMNPDWYNLPIFYFSNPAALFGHNEDILYPKGTSELDFELEFAIVIANGGSNIKKEEAEKYIAGYTVCNDWSARDIQREEMAMSLGPAKGKDFATSFGPYLVTPDELEKNWVDGKLHLRMTCHINNKLVSDGNTNDLYHSFSAMIERASSNTKILPGDYFGSGTVGTGCILELRPENIGGWLKKGDVIRMEIEKLGILENKII